MQTLAKTVIEMRWVVMVVATILITLALLSTVLPGMPRPPMSAAPARYALRSVIQATGLDADWVRTLLIEQQRQEAIAHSWLEWWPVIVVGAGILVTYGTQKQWRVQVDARTKVYEQHLVDDDAHWTKREREELIRRIDEIKQALDRMD